MDIQKINTLFKGKVIFPTDPDYDEARQVFYGDIDKKPEVIIKVADRDDVKQAVLLAKEQGLELAVRSGGHSVSGYSSSNGIVIDLRDMRKTEIDTTAKTVWVETGLTAGELTRELDEYNMVLGFGDTGSVGIGGITLGAGIGYLVRKFGLAIDNLLAAEVVTASGEILQVDENNHSDLFWALRGGGGNFGVVTRFKFKLHELGDCYGGTLLLPATPKAIADVAQFMDEAPDELSAIVNVMPTFPMPNVPEEFHGKLSMMISMVYAGPPGEGEKVVAPLRAIAEPIADMLKPMRYKDMFPPEDLSHRPTAVSRNLFLNNIDTKVAGEIIDQLNNIGASIKAFQFRVLGGAVARVSSDATAYAHRTSHIMCNIACFYESAADKPEKQQWAKTFEEAVIQSDAAAYVNFLGPDEQDKLLSAYPPATLQKLQEVKAKYDPENLFRLNFNITPTTN